jgi:hypothetical protein
MILNLYVSRGKLNGKYEKKHTYSYNFFSGNVAFKLL